jgi:hypothetical protein
VGIHLYFYLFVAVGLIAASLIILKYGNDFFSDPATNPDITAATVSTQVTTGSGDNANDNAAGGIAGGTTAELTTQCRDDLIESGVVPSIGDASVCPDE